MQHPESESKSSRRDRSDRSETIAYLAEAIAKIDPERDVAVDIAALAPAKSRAMKILNQRPRSIFELRGRLREAEFAEPIIEQVIADFIEAKLLDDQEFALQWVQQRARHRGKSRRILDAELQEKGVSERIRQIALEEISDRDEENNARAVAMKRASMIGRCPESRADYEKQLRRIVGALARRGFSSGLSYRLAKEALDDALAELSDE